MARNRKAPRQFQKNEKSDSVNDIKRLETKLLQKSNAHLTCVNKKRGRPKKNLKLVVLLEKSELVENLIRDLQSDDKMVLNSGTGNIPDVSKKTQDQTSIDDRLKFIRTFKITTELNTQSRKIDMISIPLETVSMKNEKPKTVNRKFSWNMSNNIKANTLADIFSVTSSNSIFKSASLEADTSTVSLNSPKKYLTRTFSVSSLNTVSNLNRCSSRASQISNDENSTDNIIVFSRCQSPSNISPADEEYDYHSKVRSDSSGYHSEQKLSDNSPASSTVSSPKRHLRISFNNYHPLPSRSPQRTSPVYTAQDNTASVVMKRKCDFKTPKLPLFKRPPTRIRISECDKARIVAPPVKNVNRMIQRQIEFDDSDAISLYAESLSFDENESLRLRDVQEPIDNLTKPISNKREAISHPTNETKISLVKKDENLDKLVTAAPLTRNALPKTCNTLETHTSKVDQWIASAPSSKEHVNFSAFMASLQKVCYFHYGRGKCTREHCRFIHNLPNNFQNSLRDLNENQFKTAFDEIFKRTYLFKETFDFILMYFKERDSPDELIYMIQDILKLKLDKTPFIKKVIFTLKDMGYSFVEAVEEILLTHGRKTESLLDILLMFIVEEDDCLENNWHFIDKLTKFRKNKLDYGVVCEIFQKCCNTDTPRKEFCENIYKDLIIKNHVELDKIDRNLVIKYINVLYSFNMTDYAEQLRHNNGIGDHEVIRASIQQTPVHEDNAPSTSNDAKSESDSSCADSTTSSSSSSSEQSDDGHGESPEYKDGNEDATAANRIEETLKFSSDEAERLNELSDEGEEEEIEVEMGEEEEVEVEMVEEGTGVEVDNPMEVNTPTFDVSLQQNYEYTNQDLDAYLNYISGNTYSSSYYKLDDPSPVCNNSYSVHETMQSPRSENSRPIQESISTNNDELSPARSTSEMEMCDTDIMKLVTAIKTEDLSGILSLMKKSADNNMCRSFVAHTITAVKNIQGLSLCKIIGDIFHNLEMLQLHSVTSSTSMRFLTKLLAFNVLVILDKRREYGTASRILNFYSKDLDNFLDIQCITYFDWLTTKKLRYIFIFKILVRDRKLKEALKLLKSSHLELFQDMSTDVTTIEYKKRILNEFIETALQRDIQVARESILYLILSMDSLKIHIDLEKYLNLLMVKLLNSYSTYKNELLGLLDNIMNGWFKFLKDSVLRAIFVQSFYDIPERKLMDLFNICEEKRIYSFKVDMEGIGNSIYIPRNLVTEEIQFMLNIQFHRISKSNFPLENIIISTERQMEMDEYTNQINIFINSIVDCAEMIRRIQNVFTKFEHFPSRNQINADTPGIIEISFKDAQHFFTPYRTGLPSITKHR